MTERGTSGARRRRRNPDDPRDRLVRVRLNNEELANIAGRAAAIGLTVPAYLVLRGQDDVAAPQRGASLSPAQLRALAAELYALKRILRGAGNNLNQLTKVANATGDVPTEAYHHAALIARTLPRLEQFVAGLRTWLV